MTHHFVVRGTCEVNGEFADGMGDCLFGRRPGELSIL